MNNLTKENNLIIWASEQANNLLKNLPTRLNHVKGVVKKAYSISHIMNEDEKIILIASAYLHDIGYSPQINTTGFHPLDGAVYLKSKGKNLLASIIAYHSEAIHEAKLRGLDSEILKFKKEIPIVADALTYCDLTTNSEGIDVTYQERLDDIFSRYDKNTIVNKAVHNAIPFLTKSIENIEKLLANN